MKDEGEQQKLLLWGPEEQAFADRLRLVLGDRYSPEELDAKIAEMLPFVNRRSPLSATDLRHIQHTGGGKRPSANSIGGLQRVRAASATLGGQFTPPTRTKMKFIDAATVIRQQPDAVERAYLTRELVQCTLPHRDPGDVSLWVRTNGDTTLVLARTGFDRRTKKPVGYPYGSLPRLLLYWLNTEVVRTKDKVIRLGDSLGSFMRQLGLNPDHGGPHGDRARLRDQMRRLFSAAISFQQQGETGDDFGLMPIARKGHLHLWWNPLDPDEVSLVESSVELSDDFFRALIAAPIPTDLRALRALKQSPLALDLYNWATHKAFSAYRKGKDQETPWAALKEQFGSDYADKKDFKKKAITTLTKIQSVYPGLKLRQVEGGVSVLASSRPAVPEKSTNDLLIQGD